MSRFALLLLLLPAAADAKRSPKPPFSLAPLDVDPDPASLPRRAPEMAEADPGPPPGDMPKVAVPTRCPKGTVRQEIPAADAYLGGGFRCTTEGELDGPIVLLHEDGSPSAVAWARGRAGYGVTAEWLPDGSPAFYRKNGPPGSPGLDGLHRKWDQGALVEHGEGVLGTGYIVELWPSGARKSYAPSVGGEVEGVLVGWHEGGAPSARVRMAAGRMEGPFEGWHEDGAPSTLAFFAGDLNDGPERIWSPAGVLTTERAWKAGALHGKSTLYAEDGTFRSAACFQEDEMLWEITAPSAGEEVEAAAEPDAPRPDPQAEAAARACP